MPSPKYTSKETLAVLHHLITLGEDYGARIARRTGMAQGTLYPILNRLAAAGHLTDRVDNADLRKPKVYYDVSITGLNLERELKKRYSISCEAERRYGGTAPQS